MPAEQGGELADLLAPFWTEDRTAEMLGMSQEELVRQVENGLLLGIRPADGDDYYFPVWQFDRLSDGSVAVKTHLLVVIQTLRTVVDDGWTVGILLRTPAPELDDLTPEQWVTACRPLSVLETYARVLAREWRAT